jgi:hypothetical protein
MNIGTTITVTKLFEKLPVRRKSITPATERAKMLRLLQELTLQRLSPQGFIPKLKDFVVQFAGISARGPRQKSTFRLNCDDQNRIAFRDRIEFRGHLSESDAEQDTFAEGCKILLFADNKQEDSGIEVDRARCKPGLLMQLPIDP